MVEIKVPEHEIVSAEASVPEVFNLIESRADTQTLIQQLVRDFYLNEVPPEKVYLALRELERRGNEGAAALQYLVGSSDALGQLVRKIFEDFPMKQDNLERLLGIKRFGLLINEPNGPLSVKESAVREVYNYAVSKRLIAPDISYQDFVIASHSSIPQTDKSYYLDENAENNFLAVRPTVGSCEPTYLELLGPENILSIRKRKSAKSLLLGSFGLRSAKEFSSMSQKISANLEPTVIDISTEHTRLLAKGQPDIKASIVQADALELPFDDESMDLVCSNFLFHHLGEVSHEFTQAKVKKLLKEVARVLKRNGIYLLIEQSYGELNRYLDLDRNHLGREINSFGMRSGLKAVDNLQSTYPHFLFRSEVGSSVISDNGIPYYTKALVVRSLREDVVTMACAKI